MTWTTALGFGERGWGPALLQGAVMTLLVSIAGLAIGAVLGSLVAWAKLSGVRIAAAIGESYAAIFRGLPELLVVYFVYFGSSALLTGLDHLLGGRGFLGVPGFAAGALAVGVISGVLPGRGFSRRLSRHRQGRAGGGAGRRHGPLADRSAASSRRRCCASRSPASAISGRWR